MKYGIRTKNKINSHTKITPYFKIQTTRSLLLVFSTEWNH